MCGEKCGCKETIQGSIVLTEDEKTYLVSLVIGDIFRGEPIWKEHAESIISKIDIAFPIKEE